MKTTGFEIPPEMKAMAEKGIETARQAFQGYLNATEKALGTMASQSGAHESAREVSRKAMGFAQENVIDNFAFIDKLMRAKDVEEVIRLQTEFAQVQAQKLATQTKTLGEAASKAMTDGMKPR
jgi:phasin